MENLEDIERKTGLNLQKINNPDPMYKHYFKIYTRSGKYLGSIVWDGGRYKYCGRNSPKHGIEPRRLRDILLATNLLNKKKNVISALAF